MRVSMLLSVIILLASVTAVPQDQSGITSGKHNPASQDSQNNTSSTPIVQPKVASNPSDANTTRKQDGSQDDPKITDWLMVVITAAYTFVSVLVLIAIKRQTNIAGVQVKAAKDSAEAALQSAKALVNSERPWMLINIEPVRDEDGDIIDPEWLDVSFTNHGRTPAEIIWYEENFVATARIDTLPTPPPYSNQDLMFRDRSMVAPGKRWRHGVVSSFRISEAWTGFVLDDIRNNRQRAIIWGRLRYRNVIESPDDKPRTIHETRFCYFWSPPANDFLMSGPDGYNDHT